MESINWTIFFRLYAREVGYKIRFFCQVSLKLILVLFIFKSHKQSQVKTYKKQIFG
jgi:hypothetical protein